MNVGKEKHDARIRFLLSVFEDQHNGKYHGTYMWYDPANAMRTSAVLYLQQKGYEVGDKLVTDEAYFEDDIERLVKEANEAGIKLSVGRAFCDNGINDINTAVKYAISNMR